jgi:hypothetical protein
MNNELVLKRNCEFDFCLISSKVKSSSGGWVVGWLERMCAARADPREWARMCCSRIWAMFSLTKSKDGEYSPLAHSSRSLDFEHTIIGRGGLLECIPIGKCQENLLSFKRHIQIQSCWIGDGWTGVNPNKRNMENRDSPHEVWYVNEDFICEFSHHSVVYNQLNDDDSARGV